LDTAGEFWFSGEDKMQKQQQCSQQTATMPSTMFSQVFPGDDVVVGGGRWIGREGEVHSFTWCFAQV
jgi:hypothetical protein